MSALNSGQAGHVQPGPEPVLQVHGDQGGEQCDGAGGVLPSRGGGVRGVAQAVHPDQV